MTTASDSAVVWRVRAAIRRQLRADLVLLHEMEEDIASLERHIDAERRQLAALHPTF